MKKQSLLEDVIAAAPNRRAFLGKLGLAGAALAASQSMGEAQTGSAPTDFDILNFALNLEYLEAEFYSVATTGMTIDKFGVGITGSGTQGATTGGAMVAFANSVTVGAGTSGAAGTGGSLMSGVIATQIAMDERAHVNYIRMAIAANGGTAISKPAINLNALGIGFGGITDFLQLARVFEDIGVTAYAGAAPLITSKTILGAAARIAQTEAFHASNIRLQIAELGISTMAIDAVDVIPPPSGTKYFTVDANGLTQTRTPGQVLYLAYGNKANATSGGFFPAGVNGTLNTSTSAATNQPPNGTSASFTASSTNTSSPTVMLNGSGSTSGSGNLTYLYSVVPGGKVPAILQAPYSSMATLQFVNGPGVYTVQLMVTDGSGNTSTSAPVSITYTGS